MKISIIIPTYKRAAILRKTLASITAQEDFPQQDYEIIITYVKSDYRTAQMLKANSQIKSCTVSKAGNRAQQRNVAMKVARGNLLLLLDDDMQLNTLALVNLWQFYQKNPMVFGVGIWQNISSNNNCLFEAWLNSIGAWSTRGSSQGKTLNYFCTGLAFLPKKITDSVGFFNEAYIGYGLEDIEYGYKIEQAGYRFNVLKGLRAIHSVDGGFLSYFQKTKIAQKNTAVLLVNYPELKTFFSLTKKNKTKTLFLNILFFLPWLHNFMTIIILTVFYLLPLPKRFKFYGLNFLLKTYHAVGIKGSENR